MSKRTLPVLGALALAAGLFALTRLTGLAGDVEVKLVIPKDAATGLKNDDIKVINDALKDKDEKKAPAPKDLKRAKVAALDIALIAKANKEDALYAQAVKVIDALNSLGMVDKDKEEEVVAGKKAAREAAAGLSKPAGGDAKGDAIKLALWDTENKSWDRDLAMQLFKTTRAGGLAYEKTIKDFAGGKPPPVEMAKIATLAYKTAMLSQAIEQLNPDKPEWKKFAQSLRDSAIETGDAATKKNAAAVGEALNKMDMSCVNCHEKFKKE